MKITFEPFRLGDGVATIGPLIWNEDPKPRAKIDILGSESRAIEPGHELPLRLTIATIEPIPEKSPTHNPCRDVL